MYMSLCVYMYVHIHMYVWGSVCVFVLLSISVFSLLMLLGRGWWASTASAASHPVGPGGVGRSCTNKAGPLWRGSSPQLGSCKRKWVKPRLFDSASEACPERQHLKGLVTSVSKQLVGWTPDVSIGVRPPRRRFQLAESNGLSDSTISDLP